MYRIQFIRRMKMINNDKISLLKKTDTTKGITRNGVGSENIICVIFIKVLVTK